MLGIAVNLQMINKLNSHWITTRIIIISSISDHS